MGRPKALAELHVTPYVLRDNRGDPESEQVKWMIRGLEADERNVLFQRMRRECVFKADGSFDLEKTEQLAITQNMREACRYGLQGWKNLKQPKVDPETRKVIGEEDKEFPGVGDAAVRCIDNDIAIELGLEIIVRSQLTKEESGN